MATVSIGSRTEAKRRPTRRYRSPVDKVTAGVVAGKRMTQRFRTRLEVKLRFNA